MKSLKFYFSLFIFVSIGGLTMLAQDYPNIKIDQIIYISSSLGDDNNPGTRVLPKKTINGIENKKNIEIRLKRGDIFFESLQSLTGCKIGAYGYGEKPVLCGFRIVKKNNKAWTFVKDNIWSIDLTKEEDFIGYPISVIKKKKQGGNIGMIYDIYNDHIYGNLVNKYSSVKKKGDFFVSEKWTSNEFDNEGIIYASFDIDPNTLHGCCFSMGENGLYLLKNCYISDLSIVGFGKHGLVSADNTIIERCDFDLIGGCLLLGFSYWVRYGNGIELLHNNCNVIVRDCQISRVYDAATTIQSSGKGIQSPQNLHFINNRIVFCRQAFERYITSSDTNPQYVNCDFSDNLCVYSGDNKFGIPKYGNECHLLSYERTSKPLTIQNNIFFGSNYQCCYTFADGIKNNVVYIYPNQYLNHYHGIANYQTILANDSDAISKYSQRTADNSKIIVVSSNSRQEKKIKSKINKQLKYKAPIVSLKRLLASYKL